MRLHSLTMTAIGPYAGTERVDFDALAGEGLFLFTGPTGAGKTMVLDAVTYALYGRLPGTRDLQVSRLKSDFAAADIRPEVVLELSVGNERLRISRSPSYERPKRRGDGVTTERSSVAVERREQGAWLGIEGARKENVANDWLAERIGLNCDQFTQVVLLPQGQFAEFLHASDDVREKLLMSLFGAQRFKDVEDWFEQRQREVAAEAATSQARVQSLRTEALAIADIPDDDSTGVTDERWFTALAADHRTRAGALGVRRDAAEVLHTEAAAAVLKAEDVLGRQRDLAKARALSSQVANRRAEHDELRVALERAVAAEPVCLLVKESSARSSELGAAESRLHEARARLSMLEVGVGAALIDDAPDLDEAELSVKVRERTRDLIGLRRTLDAVIESERAIEHDRVAVARAVEVAQQAAAGVAAVREQHDGLPGQRDAVQTRIAELRELAAVVGDAEAAVRDLRAAVKAAEQARHTEAQLAEQRGFVVELGSRVNGLHAAVLGLREKRIDGMASELASALVAGEACVVCGSSVHPAPARRTPEMPTPEAIEEAEDRLAKAREAKELADQQTAALESALAAHVAITQGRGENELATLLGEARARAKEARAARELLDAAKMQLAELDARAVSVADELQAVLDRQRECDAQLRELQTAAERAADAIEEQRCGHETVAARAGALDETIAALEAFTDSIDEKAACDSALVKASEAVRVAAEKAGFSSVELALDAVWSQARRDEVTALIAQFDRDSASAEALLSDSRLRDVPDVEYDLDFLRSAEVAAATELRQLDAEALSAVRSATRLEELALRARGDLVAALATAGRAERVKALAQLIRGMGSNLKQMNLTSYFLAARLEQVTRVATEHLQRMSSGRYSLRHTDQRSSKRRGRSGLGLEVFDSHTGKARAPHSLSGGETFYASVSLALALAEVVTAETGAKTLDSLFIDEGFGSLDSEALDLAMGVLDDLRQVGRTVGVISHVEDMKARITNQLVIERTSRGSRVVAGAQ